jgi:hypothetical protein
MQLGDHVLVRLVGMVLVLQLCFWVGSRLWTKGSGIKETGLRVLSVSVEVVGLMMAHYVVGSTAFQGPTEMLLYFVFFFVGGYLVKSWLMHQREERAKGQ